MLSMEQAQLHFCICLKLCYAETIAVRNTNLMWRELTKKSVNFMKFKMSFEEYLWSLLIMTKYKKSGKTI